MQIAIFGSANIPSALGEWSCEEENPSQDFLEKVRPLPLPCPRLRVIPLRAAPPRIFPHCLPRP